jgi:hypothetical protein
MLFSIGSLLAIAIIVQMIYATTIRPRAEALIAQASVVKENGQTDRSNLRSPWVIIRDYEQEIAFILAIWSITLIIDQARQVSRNRKLSKRCTSTWTRTTSCCRKTRAPIRGRSNDCRSTSRTCFCPGR